MAVNKGSSPLILTVVVKAKGLISLARRNGYRSVELMILVQRMLKELDLGNEAQRDPE